MAVTPYADITKIKPILVGSDMLSDADGDDRITAVAVAVTEAIDRYCKRTFAKSTAQARTFNAPLAYELWTGDLLAITSVVLDGATLPSSQYEAHPRTFDPLLAHYERLIRLDATSGLPKYWASALPYGKVIVTGDWGYALTVPATVEQVCIDMTCRLLVREGKAYGNLGGINQAGAQVTQAPIASLDADCAMMLAPLVYQPGRAVLALT